MIIGYLSEDNKIYDKNGNFVKEYKIEKDEKEIIEEDNVDCSVLKCRKGWSRIGVVNGGLNRGFGTLLKTNRRIIFIREIKSMEKFTNESFLPYSIIEMLKARELRNKGLKEYFEVFFSEIEKVESGFFKGAMLYVSSNKNNYFISGCLNEIK